MKTDLSSVQAYKKAYGNYSSRYNRLAKELEKAKVNPSLLAPLCEAAQELGKRYLLCQIKVVENFNPDETAREDALELFMNNSERMVGQCQRL